MVMLAFQSVGSVLSFLPRFTILIFDHNIARVGISICTTSMFFIITECLVFGAYDLFSDLTYPRCTNSLVDKAETDCGSTPWAFGLFIAWNLLSMVIRSFSSARAGFADLASSIFSWICLPVSSWKTSPTFFKLLEVDLNPSLANKCVRSRKYGPSLLIERRVTWNALSSRNSFRYVLLVFWV